nr:MAG: hypothetical protein [Bacteriophage sp.]UVY17307.1 MAG: hypothetical protein [Bacteriophage sp.]UWD54662.1 MAG: hypothetical protein [Bacteriophage sp.]
MNETKIPRSKAGGFYFFMAVKKKIKRVLVIYSLFVLIYVYVIEKLQKN